MSHKTRLGPIAIFLTVVAMVITTLAILTVATSNADRIMAGRFASITETRYELEAKGEEFLSAAAAGDIAGIEGASATGDGGFAFVTEQDGYMLEVEVSTPDGAEAGAQEISKWKLTRIWNSSDPIDDIWPGF